jgi:hypothetical protein
MFHPENNEDRALNMYVKHGHSEIRDMKTKMIIASTLATTVLAATASAGIEYDRIATQDGYAWSGEDFGGVAVSGYVVDLYLELEETNVLLNVYNFNDTNLGTTYFQGLTSAGWAPNEQGSIFTTGVSQSFDSFIAIGGVTNEGSDGRAYQMAGNGVAVDPNFDNNNADGPGTNAGWFNGNPNNPIGASAGGRVLIGRFSIAGSTGFSLEGSYGQITFNQGVGTPGEQESFVVVPAPGALALLGLAGMASRRRRK